MNLRSFGFLLFLCIEKLHGFVLHNPYAITKPTTLCSSPDPVSATSSSTDEHYQFSPEFGAAFDKTLVALKSSLENPFLVKPLEHFVKEYFFACDESNRDGSSVDAMKASKHMSNALQYAMEFGLHEKFTFGVTHTALRGKDPEVENGNTVDFYKFGCDFFRPVINNEKSLLLGKEALEGAKQQLAHGENVIFFANHQSEADPQVMSILLEKAGFPEQAEEVIYVAGHKVTTDALAIPFSMGRNLICIHSKKHIDSDPDTKPIKSKQNLAAMNGMLKKLKKGGSCIWVAPSGGRDRRDLETGKVPIAPFDQKTVDMFRLMGNKSKVKTHYYALSMVSYDLCPPPDFVEAGTGEQRNIRYVPVAIKCSDELINEGGVETRHLFTEKAMDACDKGYQELLQALNSES